MSERGPGRPRSANKSDVDESLVCNGCDRAYSSKSGLRYHMKDCCPGDLEECPECGQLYMNQMGVKQHASKTHGIDLSSETKECPQCGDAFECKSYNEKKYCSGECVGEAQAERYAENRIDVECIYCGDVVSLAPVFADGRKYCSGSCRSKDLTEKGVMNPTPEKEYAKFTCEYCNEEYEVTPAESDYSKFCSKRCQGKWRTGSRNPNWRGGRVGNYGPNWHEQRRKARIRDQGRCQVCGATPLDTGRQATVHHKKPMRWFKDNLDAPEWYEKGNRLDNLVCLCRSCHGRYGDWRVLPLT